MFSIDYRSRKNLSNLLKFMNDENLMLRSLINGVELFLFTSHKLSDDSRGTYIYYMSKHSLHWFLYLNIVIYEKLV